MDYKKAKEALKEIRAKILDMCHQAGEGHIPSSYSVLEILYVIYSQKLSEDKFLLSKGHASAGFYAILSHFGLIKEKDLSTFSSYESELGGHPHIDTNKGILNSSGSLGHGFPIAAGFAL